MNGWERLRVDQIEADFASSTGYESILGDFVTTGDVLRTHGSGTEDLTGGRGQFVVQEVVRLSI